MTDPTFTTRTDLQAWARELVAGANKLPRDEQMALLADPDGD